MSYSRPKDCKTVIESIVNQHLEDQRKIIAEVTHKPADQTPQVWALYKEVQDYYDHGMQVPDDVTLLFSDDNWGQIRRLPRPGSAGGERDRGVGRLRFRSAPRRRSVKKSVPPSGALSHRELEG